MVQSRTVAVAFALALLGVAAATACGESGESAANPPASSADASTVDGASRIDGGSTGDAGMDGGGSATWDISGWDESDWQ